MRILESQLSAAAALFSHLIIYRTSQGNRETRHRNLLLENINSVANFSYEIDDDDTFFFFSRLPIIY